MRKVLVILLLVQLALSSCIKVAVLTSLPESEVDFKFNWDAQSDLPQQVDVFFARTVNTVHSVWAMQWDGTKWLDGSEGADYGTIYPGDYHAVAFATSSTEPYSVTNKQTFETGEDGLTQLYAQLPEKWVGSEEGSDETDPMTTRLMLDMMGFPVVSEIARTWIGVETIQLQEGARGHLAFGMKDVTQEIDVTLRIENKSPQLVQVNRVAIALIGVPSRISLLDQTVSVSYDDEGHIQGMGAAILELQASGNVQESGTSEFSLYQGSIRVLGLMNPVSDTDLTGYGVMKVCVLLSDGNSMIKPVNLAAALSKSPSLVAVDATEMRRAREKVSLNIAGISTLVIEKTTEEDDTAIIIWDDQVDGGNWDDFIPED